MLEPADRLEVSPGEEVTFVVKATGTVLLYQWQRDSSELVGANTSTLIISNVSEVNEGSYRCIVTNIIGEVANSSEAELTVCEFYL